MRWLSILALLLGCSGKSEEKAAPAASPARDAASAQPSEATPPAAAAGPDASPAPALREGRPDFEVPQPILDD